MLLRICHKRAVYIPPELSMAAKETAEKHQLNCQLKSNNLTKSLGGTNATNVNIEVFAKKKITGNRKKLMEIGTRLMVALKENKINYKKQKIETHLDQINKSLTQIDINVEEIVQPFERKRGKFF